MPVIKTPIAATGREETLAEISTRIKRTFNALERMTVGVIKSNVRSLMVSGAAGCGKSYTLETLFGEASKQPKGPEHKIIKGSMSPVMLYQELYRSCTEGQILMIDDCDSIFADLDSINILKAALDTSPVRRVFWNKESTALAAEDIPRDFEFDGACVFVTNIDFEAEMERGSKMSPHYEALMSRSIYVDLGIHTKKEVFVRISQVVLEEKFLKENKITKVEAAEMCRWCQENIHKMRHLSIRTILQLTSIMKTEKDWKEIAEVVMLRSRGTSV